MSDVQNPVGDGLATPNDAAKKRVAREKPAGLIGPSGADLGFKVYDVRIVFTEPILGGQPTVDIAEKYLVDKENKSATPDHPSVTKRLPDIPEDEAAMLPTELERGSTVFHKDADGNPVLFDYQIKGALKDNSLVLKQAGQIAETNPRSLINNCLFIGPRHIHLVLPEGGKMEYKSRALRALTAQGPRTAIARSEMLPVGTSIIFVIRVLGNAVPKVMIEKLLNFGAVRGLGQWFNGGWGKFTYTLTERAD